MKGKISKIKNTKGELALPITTVEAVYMEDGTTRLSDEMKDVLKYEAFDDEGIIAEIPSVIEEIDEIKKDIGEINSSLDNMETKINDKGIIVTDFKEFVENDDWTIAIRKAIEKASETNINLVFFPQGLYKISEPIELPYNSISICGTSSQYSIVIATQPMSSMFIRRTADSSKTEFKNIRIDGFYQADRLLWIGAGRNTIIKECKLFRFRSCGVEVDNRLQNSENPSNIQNLEFRNNELRGCIQGEEWREGFVTPNYGISFTRGATDCAIYNNLLINCSKSLIYDYGDNANHRIVNNHFWGSPFPAYSAENFIECNGNIIITNNFFDSPLTGITNYGDNVTITNNLFFWSISAEYNKTLIGINLLPRDNGTSLLSNVIVTDNRFYHKNYITDEKLNYDVKHTRLEIESCEISGNKGNAENQVNPSHKKNIIGRRVVGNIDQNLNVEMYSNGNIDISNKKDDTIINRVAMKDNSTAMYFNDNFLAVDDVGAKINNGYLATRPRTCNGDPTGVITPLYVGEIIIDSSSNPRNGYLALSGGSNGWICITKR